MAGPIQETAGEDGVGDQVAIRGLVARVLHDPEAFAALYDIYVDRVYSYSYRRLGSKAEAEDVTAQTFLAALSNFSHFSWRGGGFGAWLFHPGSHPGTAPGSKRGCPAQVRGGSGQPGSRRGHGPKSDGCLKSLEPGQREIERRVGKRPWMKTNGGSPAASGTRGSGNRWTISWPRPWPGRPWTATREAGSGAGSWSYILGGVWT